MSNNSLFSDSERGGAKIARQFHPMSFRDGIAEGMKEESTAAFPRDIP